MVCRSASEGRFDGLDLALRLVGLLRLGVEARSCCRHLQSRDGGGEGRLQSSLLAAF